MRRRLSLFCVLLAFFTPRANAAIASEINVQGFVSKIYQDKILIYDEGQLLLIPKHFFERPTAIHVGQAVSVRMPFQESLKLERPAIPRGKLRAASPKQK